MELVLNPKQVNTLRCYPEQEPQEYGGILTSTYKKESSCTPRDPKSFYSVKKRLYKYQLRYSQNIETILKLSIFSIVFIAALI